MKKQLLAMAGCAVISAGFLAAGCGNKNAVDGTEAAGTQADSTRFELDATALVSNIPNYEKLDLEVSYSEDSIRDYFLSSMTNYEEVTDRAEIEDGDYVLLDYTGYRDGEAFDGGTAANQYVWVSSNNGYIPGFTDGLIGVAVGETVTNDVTFPDEYPNNTDLEGVTVQFEFVIHGIYTMGEVSEDSITDEMVANAFSSTFGITTVEEMNNYIDQYMYNVKASALDTYLLENCEVTVPEDYLAYRLENYIKSGLTEYTGDDAGKWTYIEETYGVTKEDVEASVLSNVKKELIYEAIAIEMGESYTAEEYEAFVRSLMDTYGFATEDELYADFGNDVVDEGRAYVERLCLMDQALQVIVNDATAHEASATE